MVEAEPPEEHLRRALLDLQDAHRAFVRSYGRQAEAEAAARHADEARLQASRWGAMVRGSARMGED